MRMTHTTLFLLQVVAAIPAAAQSRTTADTIRDLDKRFAQAYARHDTAFALALFAPSFTVTRSNGPPKTRDQELNDIRPAPGLVMDHFSSLDVAVAIRRDTAIVSGILDWSYTMNGRAAEARRKYSATYVRGGRYGWQMIELHLEPAPPRPGQEQPPQPSEPGSQRWP